MNVFAGPNLKPPRRSDFDPLFKLINHRVNQTALCDFATEGVGVITGKRSLVVGCILTGGNPKLFRVSDG